MSVFPAPAKFLTGIFNTAVRAADPMLSVPLHLPEKPTGRVLVMGAGKASARMAEALESVWGPCEGLVITRYGYGRTCRGIEIVEASHPIPDQSGLDATMRMLALAQSLKAGDLAVFLISGGASSLLVAPAGAISLVHKQQINAALLASGAPIGDMNGVRKHLSRVKGGQLAAAAHPARSIGLLISDVPGDDPALIGSGPTVGCNSTPGEALDILRKWQIDVPEPVYAVLSGVTGVVPIDDPRMAFVTNKVIATPMQSLEAAAREAADKGCHVKILGDRIQGEAREIGAAHAAYALAEQKKMKKGQASVLLLSGGELTVTRTGNGIGGPNAEYLLSLACTLKGAPGIHALACDTDGVDGGAEIAGAVLGPETWHIAMANGLKPLDFMDRNDSHTFFRLAGASVVTGPTLTNVNDFRAILIEV